MTRRPTFLALLLAFALVAQFVTPVRAVAPVASPRVDDAISGEDVSEAIEAIRAETGVPGMVAMVLQDGEVFAWGAAGVRVEGTDEKVTIHDPFHLGSCTKAMTSTLVAIFIEEGLLDWDTKIFDVLSELEETSDPGFADATVEHLLRHRGGIAERQREEVMNIYNDFAGLEGTLPEQRLEVARMALATAPFTEPGVAMDYSNYGYMTAAAMIERLTGSSWEELMVERLLEPLEMTSAGIGSPYADGDGAAGVVVGHELSDGTWTPMPRGPGGRLHECMGPAGLLHSNLYDWSKFVSAQLAGARGEDGIVKAATFERLQADDVSNAYACGWAVGRRSWGWGDGKTISHNGSDGTWYATVTALPEWDLIVMTAVNCADTAAGQASTKAELVMMKLAGFAD